MIFQIFCGFLFIFHNFILIYGDSDFSCILPNSNEGTCVNIKDCGYYLTDFLDPDKFQEFKARTSSCFHINQSAICCETSSSSTLAPKITEIKPTPAIPSNLQFNLLKSHKNFKLFDNTKCGITHPLDRVAFGENAGLLQHPWAVRIGYVNRLNETSYNCGGTLITDRYVLTAAHCITRLPSSKKLSSVLLGDYDTEQNPDCDENDDTNCADPVQNVVVESSIFHPNFDPLKSINDIGIIRLAESAKLTQNNIKTICLPFDDNAKRITGKYEVIGWGATENSTFHKILQKANLPPYDLQKCEEKLGLFVKNQHDRKKLIDGQICAGGEKSIDACHGDSGGSLQSPVIIGSPPPRMMQFGVTSYGVKLCGVEVGAPGVYTKVSTYLKWILDNMI